MDDSNFILKWTEDLKKEIDSLNYHGDDIRKDYFGLTYDVAYCFYRGFILMDFSNYIAKGQILFKDEILEFKDHVNSVVELNRIPLLNTSYYNGLTRNFMIDCWSAFELCITTFCDGISTEEEKSKLLDYNCREIYKCLKNSTINESDQGALNDTFAKKHLTHVPIVRKTDFLFKKAKGYSRNLSKDKEYLGFLGKFRNTLHTNFIFYGNDFEYEFGHANFKFENNRIVKWYDPFSHPKRSPKLYFYMIGQLKEIWKALISAINHEEVIYYPDNEQT